MIPAAFGYRRPASIDEALGMLGSGGSDGGVKILAGGHSLLPLLKLRVASAETLVDIARIPELKGVRRMSDGRLAIGAMTTYRELMDSDANAYGLLHDALPDIGDVQVRNRGTVGGAIAHADPASDLPACLLALDAEIVARSARGERVIPITEFFRGAFETALGPDEILTEIRLPAGRDDAGSAYRSLTQQASGYALVGAAAVIVRTGGTGPIESAGIGLTGVADHAYRAAGVEQALVGGDGSPDAIRAAASHAADGVTPLSDIHADAEYRAAMAAVYTARAIEAALARLA
jgi:carbon-monoxide dehydrogenase medium subunit